MFLDEISFIGAKGKIKRTEKISAAPYFNETVKIEGDWFYVRGEKFFVKLFVKRLLKKQKIHVGSLEDLKMFFLNLIETVNSFTTVNLKEFVTFKLEAGKLEMKVKCPILRGCGEFDRRLCEKKCFPVMCSILKILNRRIKLERHLPLNLRYSEECVYRFFM